MKKLITINVFAIAVIFVVKLQSLSGQQGLNSGLIRLLDSWQTGTSTGILEDFSLSQFEELKKHDIKYIELGSTVLRNLTTVESVNLVNEIKENADKAGVEIWSVHLPFSQRFDISSTNDEDRSNMIKECSRVMALYEPLNPKKYIIHPSSEPVPDDERSTRLENCIASLKILTEEVRKYGAQLVVEDLPRTCLGNTSDEIISIVNSVGNGLGVCFDTNHLLKEKPEEFAAKTGKLITTLHVSDYDGVDERHWLPGTGIINWSQVISELLKHGYSGVFMFETSRRNPASVSPSNPDERLKPADLSDCFQKLKKNYIDSVNR